MQGSAVPAVPATATSAAATVTSTAPLAAAIPPAVTPTPLGGWMQQRLPR